MEPRRRLSLNQRRAIVAAQGGCCAICHGELDSYEIDHTCALVHCGTNDDDNLRALHPSCHRAKTRRDVQALAKAKRIAAGGKKSKSVMPGSILSPWRRRMNGKTERR